MPRSIELDQVLEEWGESFVRVFGVDFVLVPVPVHEKSQFWRVLDDENRSPGNLGRAYALVKRGAFDTLNEMESFISRLIVLHRNGQYVPHEDERFFRKLDELFSTIRGMQ